MPAVLLHLARIPVRLLRAIKAPQIRRAAKNLDVEIKIALRHQSGCRKFARAGPSGPLRIQFGSGPNSKPGWVNVDLSESADFRIDIRRDWPFPDASAELIYSEHFFEHLEYPNEVQHFLREALRVLAPGGLLSTGVPPTQELLEAYVRDDTELFRTVRERWHPDWCETPLDSINYHFRQGTEHKYAYDFRTMKNVLAKGGFESVEERSYDPELDSESRRGSTLYVDARKPT